MGIAEAAYFHLRLCGGRSAPAPLSRSPTADRSCWNGHTNVSEIGRSDAAGTNACFGRRCSPFTRARPGRANRASARGFRCEEGSFASLPRPPRNSSHLGLHHPSAACAGSGTTKTCFIPRRHPLCNASHRVSLRQHPNRSDCSFTNVSVLRWKMLLLPHAAGPRRVLSAGNGQAIIWRIREGQGCYGSARYTLAPSVPRLTFPPPPRGLLLRFHAHHPFAARIEN
jgi:hypothetical protein